MTARNGLPPASAPSILLTMVNYIGPEKGVTMTIQFAVSETSLGAVLVGRTRDGVCAVEFGADAEALVRRLKGRFPTAAQSEGDNATEELVARVVAQVEHPRSDFSLPLDLRGTAFQQRVWDALKEIPVGATASYSEVAHRIGAPRAVRAVAQACAANPAAIVIPCHRVVRSNGSPGGYRWGVARKETLLERERAA
jgi:AraC family transcriptional regulator, regulatory protein of adaptative response / methylated-DNA-[protein]-cysteine methyltransferase